jgi:valyl-tRNA synthetase
LRTQDPSSIDTHPEALRDLAGVQAIEAGGREGPASTFVVHGASYFVPLEGVVDVDAERSRLDKVIAKVDEDLGFLNKKLSNKGFMDRAPGHVVDEVRTKHAAAQERRARLDEARTSLEG